MLRCLNLAEFGAHDLLETAMILEPGGQVRISAGDCYGLLDFRVLGIVRSRAIKHQNAFGFVVIHEERPPACSTAPLETSALSWASPRAMRDFTVPSGTSRISAISM